MSSIIQEAIDRYNPTKALLLFSGGHDSLCASHLAATFFDELKFPYSVYHGNTGIGIKETREYVNKVCELMKWDLYIGHPRQGETYEDMVRRSGFPGPPAHPIMYRNLKLKPLRRYVTHMLKSSPKKRENILLITGIRKSESKIRMGYKDYITKDDSRIWCSPIFHATEHYLKEYMQLHNLPRNPVKDKICISGECLCGAFTKREEWVEIKTEYPEAANEIKRLHKIAIENGHPWDWASSPNEYRKKNPKGQAKMFMCVGCEEKNQHNHNND